MNSEAYSAVTSLTKAGSLTPAIRDNCEMPLKPRIGYRPRYPSSFRKRSKGY